MSAAPACKGAACSASHHAAASPSIVAAVQSLVGRSPLPVLGVVLLAMAAVLYVVMRRTEGPRPVAAAAAVAPRAPDPVALDPVIPDPAQREIYRPPVPEPLPTDETVVLKPRARSRPAAKRVARTASEATPPPPQATEDILPLALFPPAPGETQGTKPLRATEDGLPPMAPPPPQR